MLDTDHQEVASKIMSFIRVLIQTPERRLTFKKVVSMDLHCKNKNFAVESSYFGLRMLFCFCDN